MLTHAVFVFICFILDEILMVLFPGSYLLNDLLFIANLGFCAMILTIRKFDFLDSVLFYGGCIMTSSAQIHSWYMPLSMVLSHVYCVYGVNI